MTHGIPKIPKLTAEQVRNVMDDVREAHKQQEQDAEDRRHLTGKYAPPVGRCLVCGDEARALLAYPPWDGYLGGLGQNAHITHWQCEGCGLMYGKCPPAEAREDKTP